MSLLEDVFLEDEAGEAQELERVIEGDEYEQVRPSTPNSDGNSEKEDEAEEDKRHVDPTSAKPKRVVKNPRFILNPARLTGPRGIQLIPEHFKDFKFKGKGHEKDDVDMVLKKLEHWAYRLYPKFQFEDCLKKMETLGKKRPVMVHLHKIRTDQYTSEEIITQQESSDDEPAVQPEQDEFDKLLEQQIQRARDTPAPRAPPAPPAPHASTPHGDRSITMSKATASPSISDEQKERMLRNRRLAEERRLARIKLNTQTDKPVLQTDKRDLQTDKRDLQFNKPQDLTNDGLETKENSANNRNTENDIAEIIDHENKSKKRMNRSNVISSDEEDAIVLNKIVTVDVHDRSTDDNDKNCKNLHENDRLGKDADGDLNKNDTNIGGFSNHKVVECKENDTDMTNDNSDLLERPDNSNVTGQSGINLDSKNVADNKLLTEDITEEMDVDFSDDF